MVKTAFSGNCVTEFRVAILAAIQLQMCKLVGKHELPIAENYRGIVTMGKIGESPHDLELRSCISEKRKHPPWLSVIL